MTFSKILAASAFISATVMAAPQMVYNLPYYCPIVDHTEEVAGTPWQIGLSVPGGDTISVTETHSVGITWTLGGDLGLDSVGISAGASYSVAKSVTDEVGEGTSAECPEGDWHCSMQIVPSMLHVKGHLHNQDNDERCPSGRVSVGGGEGKPFEYYIPVTDASGNGKWTYDVCTCKNLEHWADPGHEALLCPETCTPHQ